MTDPGLDVQEAEKQTMEQRVAVLVPCFNEETAIAQVVAGFRAALPQATIYVYDNNSSDGTVAAAQAAGAVVRRERRQGKGNVVRRMFSDIDADVYMKARRPSTAPGTGRDLVSLSPLRGEGEANGHLAIDSMVLPITNTEETISFWLTREQFVSTLPARITRNPPYAKTNSKWLPGDCGRPGDNGARPSRVRPTPIRRPATCRFAGTFQRTQGHLPHPRPQSRAGATGRQR
jgi:glycosyltransferase involved in cell wall biosynthesis